MKFQVVLTREGGGQEEYEYETKRGVLAAIEAISHKVHEDGFVLADFVNVRTYIVHDTEQPKDPDVLGPCGCVDYHMADCPTRTSYADSYDDPGDMQDNWYAESVRLRHEED